MEETWDQRNNRIRREREEYFASLKAGDEVTLDTQRRYLSLRKATILRLTRTQFIFAGYDDTEIRFSRASGGRITSSRWDQEQIITPKEAEDQISERPFSESRQSLTRNARHSILRQNRGPWMTTHEITANDLHEKHGSAEALRLVEGLIEESAKKGDKEGQNFWCWVRHFLLTKNVRRTI